MRMGGVRPSTLAEGPGRGAHLVQPIGADRDPADAAPALFRSRSGPTASDHGLRQPTWSNRSHGPPFQSTQATRERIRAGLLYRLVNFQLQLFVTVAAAGWKGAKEPFTRVGGIEPETMRLVARTTIGGSWVSNASSPTGPGVCATPPMVCRWVPVMPFGTRSCALA